MRGLRGILVACLGVALLGGGLAVVSSHGQSEEAPGSKRKVRVLGKPVYSDLARKLSLAGTVKIEVLVGTDGKVKRTRVVGGHPVLAAEAEKAAAQSEFEPGPRETTEIIEFKFGN